MQLAFVQLSSMLLCLRSHEIATGLLRVPTVQTKIQGSGAFAHVSP